ELVDAGALVREAAEVHRPLAQEKGLTLDEDVDDAPGAVVRADRDRIVQVFGNLVGNAVKFTPSGGRIVVGARRAAGEVRFRVADGGGGIAPEHLPRVFERGYRGPSKERGLGFGLSIAKGIVEAHGGTIEVASEVGRGTTVTFTLPRADGT